MARALSAGGIVIQHNAAFDNLTAAIVVLLLVKSHDDDFCWIKSSS